MEVLPRAASRAKIRPMSRVFLGKKKHGDTDRVVMIANSAEWDLDPDPDSRDYVESKATPQITMNIALANPATVEHKTERESDTLEIDASEAAKKLAPIAAKMGVEAGLAAVGIPPDALALAKAGMCAAGINVGDSSEASRARAIADALSEVEVNLATKTTCQTKLKKPKVSPEVAAIRFERVLKADRHAAALAAARTVEVDELQDVILLEGEVVVTSINLIAWRNVGRATKEGKYGAGKVVLTKMQSGSSRLHFVLKSRSARVRAHEVAKQTTRKVVEMGVVTGDELIQSVHHKYRAEHEHEAYYGPMKVDGNVFHVDGSFEDTAKTIRELQCEVHTQQSACDCNLCCLPLACCNLSCLTDCFKCSCTLCLTKTDELLYEWKANAEFSKGISQALQTYTEYEGEENLDVQGYQLPTFQELQKPVKVNIASLHKSLHSIYLIYRASPTNDVTLAQLVVAPDESVQKIVSFISTLSQLVSPLPAADEKNQSSAKLWPEPHFINIDGGPAKKAFAFGLSAKNASVKGSCMRRNKMMIGYLVYALLLAGVAIGAYFGLRPIVLGNPPPPPPIVLGNPPPPPTSLQRPPPRPPAALPWLIMPSPPPPLPPPP